MTSTTTKGKGQGGKSQPKAPTEQAKGVMHRGKAAMQSPQVMDIWASGKEQPLGKAAQRGQGGDDGKDNPVWVCLSAHSELSATASRPRAAGCSAKADGTDHGG